MYIRNLPIQIINICAEGLPKRNLLITCDYTNPSEFDICLLDAWVTIKVFHGEIIANGKIFQSLNDMDSHAIVPSMKTGQGEFHIELNNTILHHIEKVRAGGDISLLFESRVLISKVNDVNSLAAPYETAFSIGGNSRFSHQIPQSDWIKILKVIHWSELELLELPMSQIRIIPQLSRALSRFDEAQECFRRGDWDATMLNCRMVFEAIVQDTTGDKEMSKAKEAFSILINDEEKSTRLNNLVKSLGNFLHLGRHETPSNITINRSDAEFSLLLTGGMLRYLSQ